MTHPSRASELTTPPTVGFSTAHDGAFGQGPDVSMKAKIVNLIASVRMVMRSTFFPSAGELRTTTADNQQQYP